MSIAAAHAMCVSAGLDDVVIARHDPLRDDIAMDQVAWWLQQTISPLTAIESMDVKPWAGHVRHQRESLVCDITGVTHLFASKNGDGESGTMAKATELLESLGLAGRMAVADTVGAAWAVSHHAIAKTHDAADRCFVVPTGQQQSAIAPLDVHARIAPETVETLLRLGIETIGQLLRLPRSGIAPRLGLSLVRRIEQALGEIDEPIGSFCAEAEHVETLSLEYPTRDFAILADRTSRLIETVRAGLATRQRGALRLTCRLDLSVHPPLTIEVGLFCPTTDARHLAGLVHHRLESTRLPSDVTRLTVSVPLTGPLQTVQHSLFQSSSSDDLSDDLSGDLLGHASASIQRSLSRLIDSLSGRLGRSAVVEVKRTGDILPESAYSVTPLAGNASRRHGVTAKRQRRSLSSKFQRGSASKNSPVQKVVTENEDLLLSTNSDANLTPSPADAMRRPMSLLPSPQLLAIAFDGPSFVRDTVRLDLPHRLRIQGVTHEIVRTWGPERMETGWWKGPSIRRDYYRIETDRSQWWWIFRDRVLTELESRSPSTSSPSTSSPSTGSPSTGLPVRYRWMLHGRFA